MQTSQKIQNQVISLFFSQKEYCIPQKETICEQLNITIYELDRILDNYYAELEKVNVFKLSWNRVHQNSYTTPAKTSFIDSIVKNEYVKLQKAQLRETNNNFGGVAV